MSMDIFVTGLRVHTLFRELRRSTELSVRETSVSTVTPFERLTFDLEKLKAIAPVAFGDISASRPLEVLVPCDHMRRRASKIRTHLHSVARKGSFMVLETNEDTLRNAGLPVDLRIYVDSPCRCFLNAAELLACQIRSGQVDHSVALFRLIALGSELCGTYSRDPARPYEGKIEYDVLPVCNAGAIRDFLKGCRRMRGIVLAREAAGYLVDGFRSPLECEFYYSLTLPARLGGIAFPKPLVNKRLKIRDRPGYLGSKDDGSRRSLVRHTRLTPDMQWSFPEVGLAMEVDGVSCHTDTKTFLDDRQRDQDYVLYGYKPLRVTYENVSSVEDLERFLALIIKILQPAFEKSRVKLFRRNLTSKRVQSLRGTLVSVFGPGRRAPDV